MAVIDDVFGVFPRLETEHLVLREIGPADAEALFAVLSDPRVARYYDDDAFAGVSQARDQIQAWRSGFEAQRVIRWGVTRKGDEGIIGSCGYYGIHPYHRRASLGYELGRAFWRQGIMTEALRAVVGFGFREMNLNRIDASVMPENQASITLLEGLGFCREGVLRQVEQWGDKGFVDLLSFSLLRQDLEVTCEPKR